MPFRTNPIYLDHNATTALAPECREAMLSCYRLGPANPSSKHTLGQKAQSLAQEAHAKVASLLRAEPSEIVFTGGGTEANHMAILGALALHPRRKGIITSAVEHPSTLMLLRTLEARGMRVTYLPVKRDGCLEIDALQDALNEDTALVTLMWANNETGVLFPIAQAAAMTKAYGAFFHSDAVQAVGKTSLDTRALPVDLLSLSGHKFHAPTGIGALFVRKGLRLPPLLCGHQERGRRGGTENLAGMMAMGVACDRLASESSTRIEALRDRLESGLLTRFPFARLNGCKSMRVPNTTNICFAGWSAERILDGLDRIGIYASPGAACSPGGSKPSHVLTAMGLDGDQALASIRFSLGRENTEEEIDAVPFALSHVLSEISEATEAGIEPSLCLSTPLRGER